MSARHACLVCVVEVEDRTGRRAEVLHYRMKQARRLACGGVSFEDDGDEWFERSGERLVTSDGVGFQSPHRAYVRVFANGMPA